MKHCNFLNFHTFTYREIIKPEAVKFLFIFVYLIKMQRAIWPLTCFKEHTVNQLQLKSDQTLHQTVSS